MTHDRSFRRFMERASRLLAREQPLGVVYVLAAVGGEPRRFATVGPDAATQREILRAALRHLEARPDGDPSAGGVAVVTPEDA